MSRKKPPHAKPGRRVEDPKQAYTTEQLAEVGAIVLIWNQIDGLYQVSVSVTYAGDSRIGDFLIHLGKQRFEGFAMSTPVPLRSDFDAGLREAGASIT